MPHPSQKTEYPKHPCYEYPWSGAPVQAFGRVFGNNDDANLSYEVAELRKEISALRADLTRGQSIFVIGQQALDEFSRLLNNL